MGGMGSGRPRQRPYLEQLPRLDIRKVWSADTGVILRFLSWSSGDSIQVEQSDGRLYLRYDREGRAIVQPVLVAHVPWHLGGSRPFMRCPSCWRLNRYLYLRHGEFVCRSCTGLRYYTQTAAPMDRLDYGIRKLQRRLAGPDDDVNDWDLEYFPKPKWMRRRTHERLEQRGLRMADRRDEAWAYGFGRFLTRHGLLDGDEEPLG